MINNLKIIKPLLTFDSEDEFYFIQILQRKKDNPGGVNGSNNSSRLIKAYYIKSVDQLEKQYDEMIKLAEVFNARVGINLNKRSFYKTSSNALKHITEQLGNKDFTHGFRAWNTACGIHNGGDKIWLLDIDEKDEDYSIRKSLIKFIDSKEPIDKIKLVGEIPSSQGLHLITKPFDTRGFSEAFPRIEIHKNNPVNLYIP